MPGESEEHANMVAWLTHIVKEQHGAGGNLALYRDSQDAERERPLRINGYLPDLYAEDVPRTFVIIGEAKTRSDLLTTRSRQQIDSFVRYLALYETAFFYLAVPLLAKPPATTLLRELRSKHGNVNVHILTPETDSLPCYAPTPV